MFSNLLTSFFVILFVLSGFQMIAQNESISKNETDSLKTQQTHFNFEISGIYPFAIGDNFASKGMKFRYGFDFGFKGYFNDHLFFGLKFQHLRAKVTDIALVGIFEHSNVNTYMAIAGYRFHINSDFDIEPSIGFGATIYRNKKTSVVSNPTIDFKDDATTFLISTALSYNFSQKLKFFIQPQYRIDFTKIDSSADRQDFFDEAHFFNILLGIRLGY